MPWIDTILEQFESVTRFTTDESEYYGPYNTLLTDLFPHTEHYEVMPQYKGPMAVSYILKSSLSLISTRVSPDPKQTSRCATLLKASLAEILLCLNCTPSVRWARAFPCTSTIKRPMPSHRLPLPAIQLL
ncbi:uncharacterized protein LACBIDRAFT_303720 [Laccaria bicolor S238N-H82]|uniref:Predicted protein n=1 Tax=Laccaria bicolor (strain S238N-H82 / ATCC MYA-4686) TaxID=486041 RepID=B0DK54_LACBS|nr:uncharacterized protein LACBIDRAFT_303720 [Laccaria bicolor S238N-H82]EDR05009.1 predicted protein [Laccaria bicolor S238N-H82]|eukprot:XP_001884399.1 predicted protein [Laccaria bicolor S238N-H82]